MTSNMIADSQSLFTFHGLLWLFWRSPYGRGNQIWYDLIYAASWRNL